MTTAAKIPKIKCPTCGGAGRVIDPKARSAALKALREASGFTLRQVATAMGDVSFGYLSDMENSKREFSSENEARFRKALKTLKATRKTTTKRNERKGG